MVARSLPRQQPVPHRIYVKVKGRWTYLYRAVDSRGQTIDFLLSAKRDAEAAKRFFRKALGQPHTVNPRTITVDKNAAYPAAVTAMKRDRELWRWICCKVGGRLRKRRGKAQIRPRSRTGPRQRRPEPAYRARQCSEPVPF